MIRRWTIKTKNGEKEVSIRINDKKEIYWIDCTCQDFQMRRIKKQFEFSDIKYFAEPCKHLKPIIELYEQDGCTFKRPKPMQGTDKCTNQLRQKLIERSNGICELCGIEVGEYVHRKQRGSNGGKYNESNCVLLCSKCHKMVHSNEFGGSKSR